jgi:hypothetical protein
VFDTPSVDARNVPTKHAQESGRPCGKSLNMQAERRLVDALVGQYQWCPLRPTLHRLWNPAHRQWVFNRGERYRVTTARGVPGRTYVYGRHRLGCRRKLSQMVRQRGVSSQSPARPDRERRRSRVRAGCRSLASTPSIGRAMRLDCPAGSETSTGKTQRASTSTRPSKLPVH